MLLQYWDDAADGVREAEGTLLPLWRFTAERGRHKALTALCWSSDYLDLFAAGYGSYGFLKQCSGLVACFSLKNPSYPEFSCATDSGTDSGFHCHLVLDPFGTLVLHCCMGAPVPPPPFPPTRLSNCASSVDALAAQLTSQSLTLAQACPGRPKVNA